MSAELRIEQADRLVCTLEPHRWRFAEERAAEIDARWNAAVAAKPKLFDGRVLLGHRWRFEIADGDREFRCAFFETRYRNFMAAEQMGFPDKSIFNVFAMAALRASDGAFLLGEMGPHTANAGQIYFPAGTPDLDDVVGDRVDLAGSVLRELEEETGLTAADVEVPGDCAIVFDGQKIACMQEVRAPRPAAEIKARIEAALSAQANPELSRIHIVREADEIPPRVPPHTAAYLRFMLTR